MWQTIGQFRVVDLFKRALAQGTLSHAYLLVGPSRVGKMTLAQDLAKALNCPAKERPCGECVSCRKIAAGQHPDVRIISLNPDLDPEGSRARAEIGIDQVREILHSASLPPFEGEFRVYIIDEASQLSIDAANCLLKTLEEPEARVVFVLLTENPRQLPATIVSRCQQIKLSPMKPDDLGLYLTEQRHIEPGKAKLLARISHGCPGLAIRASEDPGLLQQRNSEFEKAMSLVNSGYSERFTTAAQLALQFGKKRKTVYEKLDTWLSWWHDLLLVKAGCTGYITNIDFMPALVQMAGAFSLAQIKTAVQNIREAGEQLKLNANARLVLEALMLNLPRPAAGPRGVNSA
jgi:DNA polymerase-3 subunit delta'